jgi:hypothetical protein
MFNHPRRPYYNYRSEDMPQEASGRDVNTIESKRFWKLFKNLRRRQEDAKSKHDKDKKAATG